MVELVLRVTLSLAVVLALFWFVARLSHRRLGGGARSMVRVVGRQALGRNASLAVVEVGDRVLVVGVSEGGVRLLAEMDPGEVAVPDGEPLGTPPSLPTDAASSRPDSPVGGSLGSMQTWKQAWAAATNKNGAP
jgi:flagellar protein FliO/FliZ